ncbi:MAG TPA: hypothetical protein VKY92_05630, partial [Verrucomicrobiae bacterium]|nr:hypothetical protein [Verrucomicrobiae bacterium]
MQYFFGAVPWVWRLGRQTHGYSLRTLRVRDPATRLEMPKNNRACCRKLRLRGFHLFDHLSQFFKRDVLNLADSL